MGCLPGDRYGVDREVMNNTLHVTLQRWDWDGCWGWDQPMVRLKPLVLCASPTNDLAGRRSR